jgi:hypothetical protein
MIEPLAYSFTDVHATIVGPGGTAILGNDAGPAEEGISIEATEENDTMMIGGDGSVAHSQHASKAGKITVRLLKNSPMNAVLRQMYNFQKRSSVFHGKNTLVITNLANAQIYSCTGVAFARMPPDAFAKTANVIDWEFNASRIEPDSGFLSL